MLPWLFKQIILSLVIIGSLHYTYAYLKKTYTIPKTKNISYTKDNISYAKDNILKNKPTNIVSESISSKNNEENMKETLKNYIKEIKDSKQNSSTTEICLLP